MAVKSMLGKKTTFFMADKVYEGTQTYTQVANVRGVGDISVSGTTIDVTEYGEGMMREYISGLGETSDVTFTLASESPSVDAFETAQEDAIQQAVKIVLPSGKILKFDAAVTGFSYSIPVDGAYQFTATVKPSGTMTRFYTMFFDANGGSGTQTSIETEAKSATTIPSCTFTAPSGKTFSTWNTAADGTGTSYAAAATLTMTVPTTLYAIWTSE